MIEREFKRIEIKCVEIPSFPVNFLLNQANKLHNITNIDYIKCKDIIARLWTYGCWKDIDETILDVDAIIIKFYEL